MSYEVHDGDSPLLREVSCSISNREKVRFSGTWMLVVYWSNVPLFATTMVSVQTSCSYMNYIALSS